MKRKMFSIMAIAAIALTSCKKDEPASSELGDATISGNVWAELDLTDADPEAIEGMQVTVIVDTRDWDQNPDPTYDYEERVYTTTTDANGDWSLTIPATEEGYNVDIDFEDLYGTRTLATPSGTESENVEITNASHNTQFIYAGAIIAFDDEATVSTLASNTSEQYGSATVYGTIWCDYDVANWNGAPLSNQKLDAASGLGTQNVSWRYDNAPYSSNNTDVYTMAIASDGTYMLTIPTEALGGNTTVDIGMIDFLGSQIQNNQMGTADSTVAGAYSVGGGIQYYNNDFMGDGDIYVNWDIFVNFSAF